MVVPDFSHNQFRVCLETILHLHHSSSSSATSSSSTSPPSSTPGIDGLSYGAVEALRLVQSAFVSAVVDEVSGGDADPTYDDGRVVVLQESHVRAALARLGMSDLVDAADDVIRRAATAEAEAGEAGGRGCDDEKSGGRDDVTTAGKRRRFATGGRGRRRRKVRITDDMLAEQEGLLAGSAERVTAAAAAVSASTATASTGTRSPSSVPPPATAPHADA